MLGQLGPGTGSRRQREPRIVVRASAHTDWVELWVVDHGPGVPRTRQRPWSPHSRAWVTGTTPGVGLGPSVERPFIEAMGGTIQAEARGAVGSRSSSPCR
ncbi:ATP-binding protein [Kibdelosporangium aridum]|uniref:ATP-binding protein n=1 Tax=Kibdelosporangium aridum TaxID=2030 RepID=UPI0035ED1D4C